MRPLIVSVFSSSVNREWTFNRGHEYNAWFSSIVYLLPCSPLTEISIF